MITAEIVRSARVKPTVQTRLVHSFLFSKSLAGHAHGVGTLSGMEEFGIGAELLLTEQMSGVGAVTGALSASRDFSGAAVGAGAATGAMVASVELSGSVNAVGLTQGLLESLGGLEGFAAGAGAATGALTRDLAIEGAVAGVGAAAGLLAASDAGQAYGMLMAITKAA